MPSIGVFDSGLGGLTVLKQFVRVLPDYDYIYLGDNARAPYGDRSAATIYDCTRQAVSFLFENGCTLAILACNTASAEALRRLQQEWLPHAHPDKKILGVLIPAAEAIARASGDKRIGIIGTRATIQSNAYLRELTKLGLKAQHIEQRACPLLVPLIEEGWHDTVPGRMIIKKYLLPFKQKQVGTLVLGCTHYAFVKMRIAHVMGKRVTIIDPGVACAQSLKKYLAAHPESESNLSKTGSVRFLSTDASDRVRSIALRYWKSPLTLERATLRVL